MHKRPFSTFIKELVSLRKVLYSPMRLSQNKLSFTMCTTPLKGIDLQLIYVK